MRSFLLAALLFALGACSPGTTPTARPAAAGATATPVAPVPASVAPVTTAATAGTTATAPATSPSPLPVTPTFLPTVPPSPAASSKEVTIITKDYDFVARDMRVAIGTTVTWIIQEGFHTVTAEEPRKSGPNFWDSGVMNLGQKFSFTFNAAGSFRYYCTLHSEMGASLSSANMNGRITVR